MQSSLNQNNKNKERGWLTHGQFNNPGQLGIKEGAGLEILSETGPALRQPSGAPFRIGRPMNGR
jgi:hypothetical protein